ncbi:Peptidyl-prolyl cis-trans isomerase D [Durusdinium trenchii]|uniref:Peptidyl-prolyl cis-trans isomerase D n=1 Tax=Durusdinium trenchii TaxID=1381693 RepID=A0ABP0S2N7_9DINO
MASGASDTTTCEPINSGYTGTIQITCFFGVLSSNPAGCSPKPCASGSTVDVTLDGVTNTITSGSDISSGFTGVASCTDVNSAWGNDLTLRCTMGVLSADTTACEKACSTSDTVTLTLGTGSADVSPSSTIASGASEFARDCSEINSGFSGTYTLSCTLGALSADLSFCAESGCLATDTVAVTVGETTTNVPAGEALAHAGVGHGRGARSGVEWLRVDGRDGEVGGK